MKSHLATSALRPTTAAGNRPKKAGAAATQTKRAGKGPRTPSQGGPNLRLATAPVKAHTLILTGELSRDCAHELEAEIERLCGDGVSDITLDLRGLTYIDSIGVAVIAYCCGLGERRGYELSLIAGADGVQRAFARAGLSELLPFRDGTREKGGDPAPSGQVS
jgi:anti-anti-sigma factor